MINDKFDYGFECGCNAHQFYVRPNRNSERLEERWEFHSCGDVRHYSIDSVLADIEYWKDRVNLFKRLESKKTIK